MRISLSSDNFLDQKYYNIGLILFQLGKPLPAIIYFDKAAGHSMIINDETYTIIEERDVVVVL